MGPSAGQWGMHAAAEPANVINFFTNLAHSVTQRKKFIFIILYLFSPSSLAGGKMTAGLREEMSKVLGIQSKSTISDNCADVVFLYQNYGDFSGDIEYLYTEIVNRLKFKGLIN